MKEIVDQATKIDVQLKEYGYFRKRSFDPSYLSVYLFASSWVSMPAS